MTNTEVVARGSVFEEDLRSAWVPSVTGSASLTAEGYGGGQRDPIEMLQVPRPNGGTLEAPLLNHAQLLGLHEAVEPLKSAVDDLLDPGVCGYRRGAESGGTYRTEHRRFVEFVQAEVESSQYALLADVERFFVSTSWATVLHAVDRLGLTGRADRLQAFAQDMRAAGLPHLPAGYADARFLGNLVLLLVDRDIRLPFARWVDDYRVFTRTLAEAQLAHSEMLSSLTQIGLRLNASKVHIVTRQDYLAGDSSLMTSVYHPESESPGKVCAELRSVLIPAMNDPIGRRRALRFALPRMKAQGDDFATDWALQMLRKIPWEAPRLVDYLSGFTHRSDIQHALESEMLHALVREDVWLASRIGAALFEEPVSAELRSKGADVLQETSSGALWGMLLRLLSVNGLFTIQGVVGVDASVPG